MYTAVSSIKVHMPNECGHIPAAIQVAVDAFFSM
jgi:hypothetical protein